MADKQATEPCILRRMALGGLEQFPDFTGDDNDYHLIKAGAVFSASDSKHIGINGIDGIYINQGYEPRDTDSFLATLDVQLEKRRWYITHAKRDEFFWCKHKKVQGNLYARKPAVISEEPAQTE